jgi:hypothetical protein
VTASVTAGFKIFGAGGSATVTGEVSASISHQYTSTFSMTTTQKHGFSFGPGVVWQWQFTINDGCGATIGSGHDLQLTGGAYELPCCLPGYFQDITKPLGDCHAPSPNMCSPSVFLKEDILL